MADPAEGLTGLEREVLGLIEADDLVDLTRSLVAAPGENPPGGEGPTATALADACRGRGLECEVSEVLPGRPNVSAVLDGDDGPGLLLLGHTDVVPVGEGWSLDPLSGEVRNGRLFGRGSTDMKGGLAACVVAMAALRRAGVPLSGPVELAAVVDEEETGHGIRHYLGARDRSGFAGCIVAEPTDLQVIVAARGDAYFQVDVTGRASHAGNPDDGANAVYGAARVVTELERWHREFAAHPGHPLAGAPSWSPGQITGGTGTSTVPAHCRILLDRRLLPGESGAEALQALRARLQALDLGESLGLDVQLTMEMPGFETAGDHRLVELTGAALEVCGGPGLPVGGWSAACDGGFVARDAGVPVVVLGPGSVGTQAHRPDESVSVHELCVAARTYALGAIRMLGPGRRVTTG